MTLENVLFATAGHLSRYFGIKLGTTRIITKSSCAYSKQTVISTIRMCIWKDVAMGTKQKKKDTYKAQENSIWRTLVQVEIK